MVHTLTQMTKSKNSVSETLAAKCNPASAASDLHPMLDARGPKSGEAHPVSAKAWARTT